MRTIKWGIIGCGNVTEVKSGPALQQAKNSELIAVMRRNGKLAKDYAQRHNISKWYDDAKYLINDPDVDAIYIATPPVFHRKYTIDAAKSGKPVYVEKPMGMNYRECQEMISECNKYNTHLFVAYYRRGLPRFLKIKSLIDNGEIGDVRFVNNILCKPVFQNDVKGIYNWRIDPKISGGGYFMDLACHTIDILQFIFGDVKSVHGFTGKQQSLSKAEDIVSTIFTFENEIHFTGLWNFNSYKKIDRVEIIGNRGQLTFSTFGNDPIVLENKEGLQKFSFTNPINIQQPLIQTIVDELNGFGKCPSTGETGSKTNWIIDQIYNLNEQ